MCGRVLRTSRSEEIKGAFRIDVLDEFECAYNIAPSDPLLVVDGKRQIRELFWGFVPAWSKDPNRFQINARSETVASKASFRSAFAKRRCLAIANGFYEWEQGPGGEKQPILIRLKEGRVFALGAIWEEWTSGEQHRESCAILTTAPNPLVQRYHDRMPVIIDPEHADKWLNLDSTDEVLTSLMRPFDASEMEAFPVSKKVSNSRYKGADCIERVERQVQPSLWDE